MTRSLRLCLDRLERWGTAVENFTLVVLLLSLIVLSVGEILLRVLFSMGYVWMGELSNLTILWITIVASVAAARSDRHLRIDALSHFVAKKYSRFPRVIVDAFAAGICGLLAWHSYRFVAAAFVMEDLIFKGIPAWYAYAIVPIAFVLMAYRFILAAGSQALRIIGVLDEPAEDAS